MRIYPQRSCCVVYVEADELGKWSGCLGGGLSSFAEVEERDGRKGPGRGAIVPKEFGLGYLGVKI